MGLQSLDLLFKKCSWLAATRIEFGGQLSVSLGRSYHESILRELDSTDSRNTIWKALNQVPTKSDFNILFIPDAYRSHSVNNGIVFQDQVFGLLSESWYIVFLRIFLLRQQSKSTGTSLRLDQLRLGSQM